MSGLNSVHSDIAIRDPFRHLRGLFLAAVVVVACTDTAHAEPNLQPALNPAVTQATIGETICVKGWTKHVRAGSWHARRLKLRFLGIVGLDADYRRGYQLDHVVPLTLGGDPRAEANFALQPIDQAYRKDRLERKLGCLVCTGQLSLDDAQRAIGGDWGAAYHSYSTVKCRRPGRRGTTEAAVSP